MRIDYIREFIVAASYLNFTTAAKRLYSSQPKISAHIASMEQELGFKLFERAEHLALTPEGKRFFDGTCALLEDYDRLIESCRSATKSSPPQLKLGEFSLFEMFPARALDMYAHGLEELRQRHGSVNTTAVPIDNNLRIVDLFAQGEFDHSFRSYCLPDANGDAFEADDGMSVLPLLMDEMSVWMRADHPLSKYESVPVEALEPYPILLASCPSMETWARVRRDFFALHNLNPVFKIKHVPTPSTFIAPTTTDDLYLVNGEFLKAPRMALSNNMTTRTISGTKVQGAFCLCWPTKNASKAVLELADIMKTLRDTQYV